jgi:eukaryotic-like serine/threonine-protein kinase
MSDPGTCPSCGAELPPDAPKGLCPRCLYRMGVDEPVLARAESSPWEGGPPPSPATQKSPEQPTAFGDYDLLEFIAEGGMGVVYRARQRSLDRIVAVKMIRAERLAGPQHVERFHREATAAARLQHPHIIAIHETGEIQGQHFYSMDYLAGRSLAAVVRESPLSGRRAAAYVRTVAEAIQYAHEHGVLHRDLKPSNILVDAEDAPHVTDFGLARLLEGGADVTLSGQVMGSPSYMSPEQAAGHSHAVGPRTDVYALGAILYELVSGRPPFKADTSLETLKLVVETEPVPLRRWNPRLPRDLETICLKCLEKEPRRRYASAQDLADELDRFLDGRPILSRHVGPAGKSWRWCRRNPALAGLIAALMATIGAGFMGVLGQLHRAELAELSARRNAYVADMNLAQHAMAQNNLARARRLLERNRPQAGADRRKSEVDLRGWEWRYLWPRCQSDALFTLGQHSNSVSALAFAQAGRFLAARDETGQVKLWDLAARKEIAGWPEEAHQLRTLAVAPDGNRLALGRYAASGAPTVEIWSVTPRECLRHLPHGAAVVSVSFSPDGQSLATFAFDRTARIWDVATGKIHASFQASRLSGEHKGVVAFSPDGRTLAIGETDGHLRLITVDSCQERTAFPAHPEGEGISALAFSGDSRLLASASGYSDSTIRLWQVENGQSVGQLFGHAAWVIALAVSPNGKTLASASADQTVRLWNLERHECQATLRGHLGEVKGPPPPVARSCLLWETRTPAWPCLRTAACSRRGLQPAPSRSTTALAETC